MSTYGSNGPRLTAPRMFARRVRQDGVINAVGTSVRIAIKLLLRQLTCMGLRLAPARTFLVRGETYRYFLHPYNTTWKNERSVEIPIMRRVLDRNAGRRTLEIGHVLGHYFTTSHDILDKYEASPGVIAEDVVDFRPGQCYEFILSISTLEHVGVDESPRDPQKAARALANVYDNCLCPGGEFVFTLPLGYNPAFDGLLERQGIPFAEFTWLKRAGEGTWREASQEEVRGAAFDFSVPTANALVIGSLRKPHSASPTS